MADFLTISERAARAGGQVLLDWQGKFSAVEKGPRDLVTQADLASQQVIRQILLDAFPEHGFLGEETLPEQPMTSGRHEYRWIVDPLDGTVNYVHRLQNFSVSVALERVRQVIVGAVFDPVIDECYTAVAGEGAWLNGQRLRCSNCRRLNEALVAFSLPANVTRGSHEITRLIEVLHSAQATRRLGSAALNLCYLAAGRLDGYWATSCKSWDVAAGVLMVQEAGGVVTDIDGAAFDVDRATFVAAATPDLHRELLDTIRRAG